MSRLPLLTAFARRQGRTTTFLYIKFVPKIKCRKMGIWKSFQLFLICVRSQKFRVSDLCANHFFWAKLQMTNSSVESDACASACPLDELDYKYIRAHGEFIMIPNDTPRQRNTLNRLERIDAPVRSSCQRIEMMAARNCVANSREFRFWFLLATTDNAHAQVNVRLMEAAMRISRTARHMHFECNQLIKWFHNINYIIIISPEWVYSLRRAAANKIETKRNAIHKA